MVQKNKGKLIYRIPDKLYRKYRSHVNFIIGGFIIMTALMVTGIILLVMDLEFRGIIFLAFLELLGFSYFKSIMTTSPIQRFEIYENGIKPPRIPFEKFMKREEYFIYWDDIENVEIDSWGIAIVLHLKDGSENRVSLDDCNDVDAHILVINRLKGKFPFLDKLKLEPLKEAFSAKMRYIKKEISNDEYLRTLNKLCEENKEFGGAFGEYLEEKSKKRAKKSKG